MTKGGGVHNIMKMIIGALTNDGGLTPHHIRDLFIAFSADSTSVLQENMNGITNKLQVFHAPHIQGIHYVTHQNNLVVQCLSHLNMMARMRTMFSCLLQVFQ